MPWRHPEAPNWPPVRNPFEVGAGAFYITVGFLGALGYTSPIITNALTPPVLMVWLVGAGLSGSVVVAAAAVVHRDFPLSMLLESLGLRLIAAFSLYLLVLMSWTGRVTLVAFVMLAVNAGSSLWRWWQVRKVIRWMKAVSARPLRLRPWHRSDPARRVQEDLWEHLEDGPGST